MSAYRENSRYKLTDGAHFSIDTRRIVEAHGRHWHSFFEMEIILSGKGICRVNDEEYSFSDYRLFFLTPTDFHEVIPNGEVTLINLSFDEGMIDEHDAVMARLFACDRAYPLEEDEYARFCSATSLLLHEFSCGGDNNRRLLGYILSCLIRKNPSRALDSAPKNAYLGSVLRAYAYMQTHFKEKITLEELSTVAGYHPAYFSEIFKKMMGETYIETLARLRVTNACTLLTGGASVSEACFSSGFGSLSNFFEVFKKQSGLSPSAYKKRERLSVYPIKDTH